MNKKIILTTGILLLLAIAGCKDGSSIFGSGKKTQKNLITDVDIRKGATGLEMNFIPNAPPERVFEEGVFPVSLNIKNSGAADIEDGILVFGMENAFVELEKEEYKKGVPISIKGKSVYNPQGDQDFKQLNAKTKKIGPQSETHTSTIFATACYPYKTIFGTSACIDTDIIGERKGQKVCAIKDLTFSEGQGAPVKVTKVETRMLPRNDGKITPSFIIYFENSGNGEVIDSDKVKEVCGSSALNYKDFNTLKASASLSGTPLKCGEDGKGIVRLKDKKDMIRCTSEGEGIDASINAYTTPLKVEFNYGYTFTISKNIIIEKVLTH